jgi:hypothetical protein
MVNDDIGVGYGVTCRTSPEAEQRICWVGLEAGETFYCFGDKCSAWIEVAFDHDHDGDDISPKGECALLIARLRDS